MKCTNCGASIERTSTFCGYCGSAVLVATTPALAGVLPQTVALAASDTLYAAPASNDSELKPYYQEQFALLDCNPANKTRFNWTAFWFNMFWYLYQGMWAKAGLIFLISMSTAGAAGILLGIYAGFRGNHDYWLWHRHHKQMW